MLLGCHGQDRMPRAHRAIFVQGRRFSYAAAHYAPDGRPLGHDTVTITCLGKYKPEDEYDTTQLKIGYSYDAVSAPNNFTGVLENDTVLWIHPPREDAYRILELSPFPYVKLPARQGQRWQWALGVGSQWGDKRWATWKDDLLVTSTYEVTGQQTLSTPVGKLRCWVVQARATCPKGTTALTSFYNPSCGFVRLAYRNVNKQRVVLTLVDTTTVAIAVPNKFLPEELRALGSARGGARML